MSDTIQAIRGLLNLPRLSKFYAEANLDDGRVVVTEADAMAIGVEVKVMNDAGEAADLDDGTYTLEDGTKLTIAEGRIAALGDEEEAPVEAEEVVEEEMEVEVELEEADEDEMAAALRAELGDVDDEMMARILAAVKKMYEEKEEEMSAEVVDQTENFASELSVFAKEVSQVFDVVLARLDRLENAPASEGVQVTPTELSRQDLPNPKSAQERAWLIMNQYK